MVWVGGKAVVSFWFRLRPRKIDVPPVIRHVVFLVLLVAGCRGEAPVPSRSVTDDLGRTLVLPDRMERIVTLAPSVTELVVAAGAGHLLVAVTDADDFPPEVDSLPRIQALPVNREAVVALAPDLVIASEQVNDPRDADALAELGIATWFVRVDSLSDVPRALRALGDLLGTAETARRTADSLEAIRTRLRSSLPSGRPPTVLVLIDDRTLFSFGAGSYVHEMVALAGGRSITADLETRAPRLSDEFVLTRAPEVIVGSLGDDYRIERLLEHHPTWTLVPAVRDRAVYSVPGDLLLRPGPRLFAGALLLREALGTGPVPGAGSGE